MTNVLLVEDCPDALALLECALEPEYDLFTARTLAEARVLLDRDRIDLAILDLSLPDGSGLSLCSALQSDPDRSGIPILFLSASKDSSDKVMAFQLGAEDYIEKPFERAELRARIAKRLRRAPDRASEELRLGDVRLDGSRFCASLRTHTGSRELDLTPHEFRLLHYLGSRRDRVVARDTALSELWGPVIVSRRTVDAHVSNIRGKVMGSRVVIDGIRGVGYRLRVRAAEESVQES